MRYFIYIYETSGKITLIMAGVFPGSPDYDYFEPPKDILKDLITVYGRTEPSKTYEITEQDHDNLVSILGKWRC
jgi:hypothetical protein